MAPSYRDFLHQLAVRLRLRRPETQAMKRFREIQELHDLGVAMYRQRMRNEHPQETEAEIDARVWAWLQAPRRAQFLSPPPKKDDDDSR